MVVCADVCCATESQCVAVYSVGRIFDGVLCGGPCSEWNGNAAVVVIAGCI